LRDTASSPENSGKSRDRFMVCRFAFSLLVYSGRQDADNHDTGDPEANAEKK